MRSRRFRQRLLSAVVLTFTLASCAGPAGLPSGPTPIPTLIPVGEGLGEPGPTAPPAFPIQSYPAQLPSAARGKQIFDQFCTECHGQTGIGVVPGARNFQDLDYMRGETSGAFYQAITQGQGQMPSYSDALNSDERWDVVYYIWRLATHSDTIESGRSLYLQNCASCHGDDGSGEVLGSADLSDLRQMDGLAPRDLYLTVTQGRGSMPAWQGLLSQDERWAIIDYLLTFTYDPVLPGEPSGPQPAETPVIPPTLPVGCSSEQENPYAWDDAAAVEAGQALYQLQCAGCHAADGSGALPNTPDFTSSEVAADLRSRPGTYFCALTEGVGAMPGFGQTLSAEERWHIITFLGSLGP